MPFKLSGEAQLGSLSSAITAGQTTLPINSGHIGRFDTLAAGEFRWLVIIDRDESGYARFEFCKEEGPSPSGNDLNVVRGQLGTTALAFPIGAGTPAQVQVRVSDNVANLMAMVDGFGAIIQATAPTLTNLSPRNLILSPTGAITLTLPTTDVWTGKEFRVVNNGTAAITINSSDGSLVVSLGPGAFVSLVAIQDTPTAAGHWKGISGAGQGFGLNLADSDETLVLVPNVRYTAPTLTANRTKTFDSSLIAQGQRVSFFNADSAQSLILVADDGNSYYTLKPGERVEFEAVSGTPADGTEWIKVDGSKKIRVFSEVAPTFAQSGIDTGANTLPVGTNDGLSDSVAGEWDKFFYLTSDTTLPTFSESVGATTPLYIVSVAAGTCQVALSPGGTPLGISAKGSGNGTLTPQYLVPLGVHRVYASVTGGGGGGGSSARDSADSIAASGGGGQAGGTARGWVAVMPGSAVAVTVGSGGTAGSAPADGVNGNQGGPGGDSVFISFTGEGGSQGGGASQVSPGFGGAGGNGKGTATGGNENIHGSNGAEGVVYSGINSCQSPKSLGGASIYGGGTDTATDFGPWGSGGFGGAAVENNNADSGRAGVQGIVTVAA